MEEIRRDFRFMVMVIWDVIIFPGRGLIGCLMRALEALPYFRKRAMEIPKAASAIVPRIQCGT
jgi:hypothetical protein